MIAFAAAPIMGETGSSPEEYSFVTAAYACVAIVMISLQRWLVERIGWRIYIWSSLAIFSFGAWICSQSDTYHVFLFGRVVMALGGASFMTGARVLVNLLPPSPLRFTGIKVFATGLALGTALSPFLAALAVSEDTWSALFFILIAVAIVTFMTVSFCLPWQTPPQQTKSQSHPFLLMWLAGGAFAMLWALQRSNYNFFSDLLILSVIALTGLSALIYFFNSMARFQGEPLLMVRTLFANRRYIVGLLLFSLCYLLLGANNYIIPQILQQALGYSWSTVGNWHALGLSSALVAWLIMGRIMPKRPASKKFFVTGFLALAAYGWLMSGLTPTANIMTDILPALLCNGIFIMLVMATTAVHTFREVQHNETVFSHAQQVKNMAAQFCMALGISAATIGMQWRTTVHYAVLNTYISDNNPHYTDVIEQVSALYARQATTAVADNMAFAWVAQMLKQQATLLAGLDYFLLVAMIGVVGAMVMAMQRLMK
ncbi:Multidrug resistance protein B [Serratia ficaria]|uniref:Multidrug resistance protein B n=2 Tax=Serratia ficaria TaxID=61651 RepID=A0A240AMV8_SERFI|nr:Multidrug resistance protein B [Serratia ficaria]CAI0956361.1 Multidrug resistance protein B [Serratia ficaria]CAI1040613.1 Multidrug resistance protein B [Serratia ficaria]CAI2063376.1 Multidrug resistance protein B [Serratia ficaria]SNV84226.1 Multidrug resistance protein B [Serratia ficaria]